MTFQRLCRFIGFLMLLQDLPHHRCNRVGKGSAFGEGSYLLRHLMPLNAASISKLGVLHGKVRFHHLILITKDDQPCDVAVELLPPKYIKETSPLMGALEEWTRFRRACADGSRPHISCHGFCPRIRNRRQLIVNIVSSLYSHQ